MFEWGRLNWQTMESKGQQSSLAFKIVVGIFICVHIALAQGAFDNAVAIWQFDGIYAIDSNPALTMTHNVGSFVPHDNPWPINPYNGDPFVGRDDPEGTGTNSFGAVHPITADTGHILDIVGDVTIFARVRFDGFNGVDDVVRFGGAGSDSRNIYGLEIHDGQAAFVVLGEGDSDETSVLHTNPLETEKWYDLTGVFDSAAQTIRISLYDTMTSSEIGQVNESNVSFSALENYVDNGTLNLLFLEAPSNGNGINEGAMIEVAAILNRVLTDTEIAQLSAGSMPVRINPFSVEITEGIPGIVLEISLMEEPANEVHINVSSDSTQMFLNSNLPGESLDLVFSIDDWNTPENITVTAVEDTITEEVENAWLHYTVSCQDCNTYNGSLFQPIQINDNDSIDLIIDPYFLNVVEGQQTPAVYSLRLADSPPQEVGIYVFDAWDPNILDACGSSEGRVKVNDGDNVQLTFTPENYNIPQSINVLPIDDTVLQGGASRLTRLHHIHYADINNISEQNSLGSVTVTIEDNDCGAWGYNPMDLNEDCFVDLRDLAVLSQSWLNCTMPFEAGCTKVQASLTNEDYSDIRGFNYVPSYARNDVQIWMDFDPVVIDRELEYAEWLNLNSARIFLQYAVYEYDRDSFMQNYETFLTLCQNHNIRAMVVLFDSCFGEFPDVVNYADKDWMANPGQNKLVPEYWPELEAYIDDVCGQYQNDPRILMWDVMNEPTVTPYAGTEEGLQQIWTFLEHFSEYVREVDTTHPRTIGWSSSSRILPFIDYCEVIGFHNYTGSMTSLENDILYVKSLGGQYDKPVVISEVAMRSTSQDFWEFMPILKNRNIGWFFWELMLGKTQFSRGDNPIQGLITTEGECFDPREIAPFLDITDEQAELLFPRRP